MFHSLGRTTSPLTTTSKPLGRTQVNCALVCKALSPPPVLPNEAVRQLACGSGLARPPERIVQAAGPEKPHAGRVTPAKLAALSHLLRLPITRVEELLQRSPAAVRQMEPQHVAQRLRGICSALGVTPKQATFMTTKQPAYMLLTPLEAMRAKVLELAAALQVPPAAVHRTALTIPSILHRSTAVVQRRVQAYSVLLRCTPLDVLHIMARGPEYLSDTPSSVRQRMTALGFVLQRPRCTIAAMLQARPDLVSMSGKVMNTKVKGLMCIMNKEKRHVVTLVVKTPALLRCNLDAARAVFEGLQGMLRKREGFVYAMVCHAPHLLLLPPPGLHQRCSALRRCLAASPVWCEQFQQLRPPGVAQLLLNRRSSLSALVFLTQRQRAGSVALEKLLAAGGSGKPGAGQDGLAAALGPAWPEFQVWLERRRRYLAMRLQERHAARWGLPGGVVPGPGGQQPVPHMGMLPVPPPPPGALGPAQQPQYLRQPPQQLLQQQQQQLWQQQHPQQGPQYQHPQYQHPQYQHPQYQHPQLTSSLPIQAGASCGPSGGLGGLSSIPHASLCPQARHPTGADGSSARVMQGAEEALERGSGQPDGAETCNNRSDNSTSTASSSSSSSSNREPNCGSGESSGQDAGVRAGVNREQQLGASTSGRQQSWLQIQAEYRRMRARRRGPPAASPARRPAGHVTAEVGTASAAVARRRAPASLRPTANAVGPPASAGVQEGSHSRASQRQSNVLKNAVRPLLAHGKRPRPTGAAAAAPQRQDQLARGPSLGPPAGSIPAGPQQGSVAGGGPASVLPGGQAGCGAAGLSSGPEAAAARAPGRPRHVLRSLLLSQGSRPGTQLSRRHLGTADSCGKGVPAVATVRQARETRLKPCSQRPDSQSPCPDQRGGAECGEVNAAVAASAGSRNRRSGAEAADPTWSQCRGQPRGAQVDSGAHARPMHLAHLRHGTNGRGAGGVGAGSAGGGGGGGSEAPSSACNGARMGSEGKAPGCEGISLPRTDAPSQQSGRYVEGDPQEKSLSASVGLGGGNGNGALQGVVVVGVSSHRPRLRYTEQPLEEGQAGSAGGLGQEQLQPVLGAVVRR
ncbi:hypothetical protein Agub_g5014 [Astrephomene gubernaculifera]|uniref:Uncharacterized protein n=1 Tax=Astrephomene gubernaculifera TaxID=47775 RepID=A0AAD3DL73_9CHLO|nr:hypothetical protein Agub_g5014 [Astrephomene gubernaculifera]